jgi:5'(3')-deoxyribonucleotidase
MKIKKFSDFLLESKGETLVNFFFDMDGVLADFEKGIENDPRYTEVIEAKEKLFSYVEKNHPEVKRMHIDDVKPILASGNEKLRELYDRAHDLVHEIADQKGFFLNLEPMPGSREILQESINLTGKLPTILTAPTDSIYCVPEKMEWMKKHFSGLYDQFFADKNKGKFAKSKYDVLIDDRKKYEDMFKKNGGSVVRYDNYTQVLKDMRKIFNTLNETALSGVLSE